MDGQVDHAHGDGEIVKKKKRNMTVAGFQRGKNLSRGE